MNALLLPIIVFGSVADWEVVDDDQDLKVWTRDREASSYDEIRATITLDAPAARAWAVLDDVARYREFMPRLEDAFVLERIGDTILYQYQKVDPPVISARDFVMRIEIERESECVRRRFRAANHPASPETKDGTVRITTFEGMWTVCAVGPERSELTYQVYGDPGGRVPSWLANYANTMTIPRLMRAFRDRIESIETQTNF